MGNVGTNNRKKTSKIHTWKPKANDIVVDRDGKLFVCYFDKVFGQSKLSVYNRFLIRKESYINQLDIITNYTNFFINNYDDDNELVTAYLKIKYSLDKKKMFNADNMDAYIKFIYEVMFTESMVEKINRIVEENYLDDIETTPDDKDKYIKNEKKHLESLEFTNQHVKILLMISFGMKIMSPVLFHYIEINSIKIEKDSDIIFNFYYKLFELFGYGKSYDLYDKRNNLIKDDITEEEFQEIIKENDLTMTKEGREKRWYNKDGNYYCHSRINIYNKLFVYVKAKVLESNANNAPIFEQRQIFGVDVYSVINSFTKKVLISENLVKYKFNEHWDEKQKKYKENIVGLILSSIKTLLIAGKNSLGH